ncbi:protein of unknown function (DUF1390) [Paramecium bursaria Chlorella virus Fr5L]|nr:protein of unknown function (DUF1390) [Paramecium bursaria Chlorella virus Fr5L]
MVKFINGILYSCSCGYETLSSTNSVAHSRTKKCKDSVMNKKEMRFVSEEDYDRKEVVPQTVYNGNVGSVINDSSINLNITLAVPDRSAVEAVYDVFKKPEFISEIRGADPQQIPAILFRYTRGICADQKFIKYDSDKNVVVHKDPVTGKDTTKDLKKYRNEYLKESANLFDDDYHIPYAPQNIQRALKDMTAPSFDTGKKKEKPISGAQVIKMCATGDHRMYKFPIETKEFYNDVAKNVDVEIKSTDKL